MPVSHDHLKDVVRVWDGMSFDMMPTKAAKAAEKKGLVQITTNLQGHELKHAREFNKQMEPQMPPGVVSPSKSKKSYKTRQMKAES